MQWWVYCFLSIALTALTLYVLCCHVATLTFVAGLPILLKKNFCETDTITRQVHNLIGSLPVSHSFAWFLVGAFQ